MSEHVIPAELRLGSIVRREGRYVRVDEAFVEDVPLALRRALALPRGVTLWRLRGDNVTLSNAPVGEVRGWQTYAAFSAPLEVVAHPWDEYEALDRLRCPHCGCEDVAQFGNDGARTDEDYPDVAECEACPWRASNPTPELGPCLYGEDGRGVGQPLSYAEESAPQG